MIGESEFILRQVEKHAAFVTSLLNRVTLQAYPSLDLVTNGYHASISTTSAHVYVRSTRLILVLTRLSTFPCACLTKLKSLKSARLNYRISCLSNL